MRLLAHRIRDGTLECDLRPTRQGWTPALTGEVERELSAETNHRMESEALPQRL